MKRQKSTMQDFKTFKDGFFNLDVPPNRYNYALGYVEGDTVQGIVEQDLKSSNKSRTTFED